MHLPTHDEAARLVRRWIRGADPRPLGRGMEGLVYEIDQDRVAKVWFGESATALRRTRAFYDALAGRPFGFEVPRIHEVHVVEGRCVTIERRLGGSPLADHVESGGVTVDEAQSTFLDVLSRLGTGGPLPEGRAMPVMDEEASLYDAAEDFPMALHALAERRVTRFRGVLEPAVEDLDKKVTALRRRLCEVDSGRRSVVHGDLTPGNVLVDAAGSPTAVLDWGFLTTEGDPVFDASVAASIFDMYGERALETELGLYARIEERLGCEREALLVYRAAYALVTANAYDAAGEDGHFAWCAAALNRPDVVRALLG
ncbi:aminoglycoside phosphotransferase family protein [Streptomyces spongiicola]|uniref:phosphotransferase family protein n=1 Tax=Streptomyces spongiicola TaxID=1690221 RepID=UPI0033D3DFE2